MRNRLSLLTATAALAISVAMAASVIGPKAVTASTAVTALAFRTPVGAVAIAPGTSKNLGTVDVSPFSQIRLVADERVGSPTNVTVRLTITEGSELVAQLVTLTLSPHSQRTLVL